jgi:hypothetical protein
MWALMTCQTLEEARRALAQREGIPDKNAEKHICSWTRGDPERECIIEIGAWALSKGIDHIIWTALPPKFKGQEIAPAFEDVLLFLSQLSGPARDNAENYVRNAPAQIDTQCRRLIEARLGWIARATK